MKTFTYFKPYEFKNCIPSCNIEDMNEEFITMLDLARHNAGIPFRLNSAYRTEQWERSKGRSGQSAHTKGLAVDINCNDNRHGRYLIIKALLNVGFNRIGIYENHIHVDYDQTKSKEVIWLGEY